MELLALISSKIMEIGFNKIVPLATHPKSSMELLRKKFNGKLISKWGDVTWPARSPDLIVPNYYLGILEGHCVQKQFPKYRKLI